MSDLHGKRIALLEGRMETELAGLVRRHGGEPYCVPAVRETPLDCGAEVAAFLNLLSRGSIAVAVFMTGVGVTALFTEAARLGRRDELAEGLAGITTVCRGPKPTAALKRQGLTPSLGVAAPYTAVELMEVLEGLDLAGQGVALLHYGERNTALAAWLAGRGANIEELCLYEWQLPDDLDALERLIQELLAGAVDAIAFTSQIQVRHLFQVAAARGLASELAAALNTSVVVGAVGPTCAAALTAAGVTPDAVPDYPKMGPMVLALATALQGVKQEPMVAMASHR
jgi:uroporphyrinogen-III synthase